MDNNFVPILKIAVETLLYDYSKISLELDFTCNLPYGDFSFRAIPDSNEKYKFHVEKPGKNIDEKDHITSCYINILSEKLMIENSYIFVIYNNKYYKIIRQEENVVFIYELTDDHYMKYKN